MVLSLSGHEPATEVAISDSIHGTGAVGNWVGQRQQTLLDEVSRTNALSSHGSFILFIASYQPEWLVSNALNTFEYYCVSTH
jgi:hypothetical protein